MLTARRLLHAQTHIKGSIAWAPARQSRLGRSLLLDGVLDVLHGAFHLALGAVYLALLLELLVARQGARGLLDLAFDLVDYFAHCVLTVADAFGRSLETDSLERRMSDAATDVQVRIRESPTCARPRPGNPALGPPVTPSLVRLARKLRLSAPQIERRGAMSTMMWVVLIAVLFVMFGGGGGYYWSRSRR